MQEDAYKVWLQTQSITEKTTGNQISRIHRLEAAFGDLDTAFDADQLAAVLAALAYSKGDAAAGKPLPTGIVSSGDFYRTAATLRHAVLKYRSFRLDQASAAATTVPHQLGPLLSPKPAARSIPPTGYWIFQANPARWDADAWARSGEGSLLYYISKHDRQLVQGGDLGVIRRTASRGAPAAILALVEVVEPPALRPEPDPKYFVDPILGGKPEWRVRLERLVTFDDPLIVRDLPSDEPFALLRHGLQWTTTPLPAPAFAYLAGLADFTPIDLAVLRGSRSSSGLKHLQVIAGGLTPRRRTVLSRRIERGPIGDKVKAARGHRCQICQALGSEPIAFLKGDGAPYAEAHHVILVSTMQAGVLDATNVMVLCPNHHRQAHYGQFEIMAADDTGWTIRLDGAPLFIEQTAIW